jgi:penicillin-binding protein 1A
MLRLSDLESGCQVKTGVDVLNLFTRLKELSDKLPLTGNGKANGQDLSVAGEDVSSVSPAVSAVELDSHEDPPATGQISTADLLYPPTDSHLSPSAPQDPIDISTAFDGTEVPTKIQGKVPGVPLSIRPTELVHADGQTIDATSDPDLTLQRTSAGDVPMLPIVPLPPPTEDIPPVPTPEPSVAETTEAAKATVVPGATQKVSRVAGAIKGKAAIAYQSTRATIAKPFQGENPLHKKPLFWAGATLGTTALVAGGAYVFVDQSVSGYNPKDALTYVRPGTIAIKGVDGTTLLHTGNATSENLKLWQIPEKMRQAFVAIEDSRFYQHDGVDYRGVTRALVSNVKTQGVSEGASSINQQLARMVYLNQEKSFWRKLREMRLAQKLDDGLSKDKILERYLNLVYLGEGAYGVGDAAWVYFSKTVDQLSLAEMATLAAMPPAPNRYSPLANPRFAKERRNFVLDRMVDSKYITVAEANAAKAEELKPTRGFLKREAQKARYFTKYIEQELPKYISKEALAKGGLTVETTLNPEWQNHAEDVIENTVKRNRGSFGQAAMVAIDPRTGGIRAMVGGTDFAQYQFNRVTQAQRQPGSTFKPIVYATAIAGGLSPYKTYLDAPYEVDRYKPKNASKKFRGSITMREALVNSVNIVAIKVLIDAGWEPTMDMAKRMGIQSKLEPFYSLALGGLEVNLLELTSAYTTFANNGVHNPVHGINRITNANGDVLYQNESKPDRILQEDTNAIMTWMMRGVVNEGTGSSAQIGRPVAGKTGTTDKEKDLWFVGYIPQLVTGVWLGNDNSRPTGNASSTAAYTWGQFMRTATAKTPSQDFIALPSKLEKRKAEIKLDPVRPGYQKNLPMPKDGEDQDKTRAERNSNSEEQPRRRRRRRQEG